jgi:hypothetical protein
MIPNASTKSKVIPTLVILTSTTAAGFSEESSENEIWLVDPDGAARIEEGVLMTGASLAATMVMKTKGLWTLIDHSVNVDLLDWIGLTISSFDLEGIIGSSISVVVWIWNICQHDRSNEEGGEGIDQGVVRSPQGSFAWLIVDGKGNEISIEIYRSVNRSIIIRLTICGQSNRE